MRTILFIITLVIGGFYSSAQNVPNGDFERWTQFNHYELDNYFFSPIKQVTRTTDALEGRYAVKLENRVWNNGNSRSRSYCQNVISSIGQTGFDFKGDVLSVVFFAKYDLATGDTARILVRFYENASYKGYVDFRMSGSTNGEFAKHSIPIFWYGSRTPDRVQVYLYSNENNAVEGNGYIIFDDLHFENLGRRAMNITNFGFEDWTNTGVKHPNEWAPLALVTYDAYNYFIENGVSQSSDAFNGSSALKIKNYMSGGTARASYIYSGTKTPYSSTPAFRIYNRYKYLEGYYKYHNGDGTDSGRIFLRTFRNGNLHSYSNKYLGETNGSWKYFSIPINYYNDSMPDSASILMYSTYGGTAHEDSYLIIDGLDLVMNNVSAGIHEMDPLVRVYPVPVEDRLHIDLPSPYNLQILNVLGQEVGHYELSTGDQSLDMTSHPPGTYYLIFSNNERKWQTKILKQ